MITRLRGLLVVLASALSAGAALAQEYQPTPAMMFDAPDIASPTLSPSGERLAIIRQDSDYSGGTVLVFDLTGPAPAAISSIRFDRPIWWVRWANEERLLTGTEMTTEVANGYFYYIDEYGRRARTNRLDLNVVFASALNGSDSVILFDPANNGITTNQFRLDNVIDFLPDDPDHVLMTMRSRNRNTMDVHRVNVYTGDSRKVDSGREETLAWFTNSEGVTVMRLDAFRRFREVAVLVREEDGSRWTRVAEQSINNFSELQDGVEWIARSQSPGEALVVTTDPETRTAGLMRYDFFTASVTEPVYVSDSYDLRAVYVDPVSASALGLSWADEYNHIEIFDPLVAEHMPTIREYIGEGVDILPWQVAGDRLLVRMTAPTLPGNFAVYQFSTSALTHLGAEREELSRSALADVGVFQYTARDETELFGYVTLPANPAASPTPLVVLPHGGPISRDYHEFDQIAQLIAASGYAVFQPQFRGSSGFGLDFVEAGHGQWGDLIQTDITDGVNALLRTGSFDPDKVCVAGWSFGGYSALMQAVREPELYQCAIAGAPVTDLPSLLAWEEERADAESPILRTMLGADDEARMQLHSPVQRAGEITIPVLLVHGETDSVVPISQSVAMNEALAGVNADVEFFRFNGGHGLNNQRDLREAMFEFTRYLDEHLGEE